jgi:hypothetical protein
MYTTHRVGNQSLPDFTCLIMFCNDWVCVVEEAIGVNINDMTNTWFISIIIFDSMVYLAFEDLPLGPVWEAGLGVSNPAIIARSTVKTEGWNWRSWIIQLLLVNF